MNPLDTNSTVSPSVNGQLTSTDFLHAALGSLQANVFIADPKLTIIYVNDRALETLRGIEGELRRAFGVGADDLLGGSIHRFHKDARKVERILRNPTALPHQAEFSFGTITLQAKINGVFGPREEILGYVVNWEDVTYRSKLELDYVGQIAAIAKVQAVIEFAIDGTIIMANEIFLRLMGYTLEEVKNQHHRLFVEPAYASGPDYRQFWGIWRPAPANGPLSADRQGRAGRSGARARTSRSWTRPGSRSRW